MVYEMIGDKVDRYRLEFKSDKEESQNSRLTLETLTLDIQRTPASTIVHCQTTPLP